MPPTHRRRTARSVALAAAAGALGGAAASAPTATAASQVYPCGLQANEYCNGARHTIISSSNWTAATRVAGAAASTTTGTGGLYGSWVWGNSYACHVYGAGTLLYPLIMNGSSLSAQFYGESTWGTGADSC